MMLAKELGLNLELKKVDLLKGEQKQPEFLELNPQHIVPVLDDEGFILCESRAIMAYLINKYAPGHSLYPSDPQKRAKVDRMLYFDATTLAPAQRDIFRPVVFQLKPIDPEAEKSYREKLSLLETLMGGNRYLTGDTLTVADLSILALLSLVDVLSYDLSGFPKLFEWMNRLKSELPYYSELNQVYIDEFKQGFEAKKQAAQQ
jgi:glutathione S-transferase